MDQKVFEDELKRDGYDVMTNTTPGAKVNPEHSHPFDVKALVLKGAMSLTRDGKTEVMAPGRYDCQLVKLDGEWLFKHRLVMLDGEVKLDGI